MVQRKERNVSNAESKRLRQREASKRYRDSLSLEQKQHIRERQQRRKKQYLASLTNVEMREWRERQRQYHRTYISSLSRTKLEERRRLQVAAAKRYYERKKERDVTNDMTSNKTEILCTDVLVLRSRVVAKNCGEILKKKKKS